jgi:hypothetical protein
MAEKMINEGSTGYIAISFFDQVGAAANPTSVEYRVDCLSTARQILDWTTITPATSVEIQLTPAQNAILNPANSVEKKLVTVRAQYGAGEAQTDQFEYVVRNLAKV